MVHINYSSHTLFHFENKFISTKKLNLEKLKTKQIKNNFEKLRKRRKNNERKKNINFFFDYLIISKISESHLYLQSIFPIKI